MNKLFFIAGALVLSGCTAADVEPTEPSQTPTVVESATPTPPATQAPSVAPVPSKAPVAPSKTAAVTKTPTVQPTSKPEETEHNSGTGDDECYHDCGDIEPTQPSKEQELQALELYWDSLSYDEVITLCSNFRSNPSSAAVEWKQETSNPLPASDIANWFTVQCISSGI